MVVDDDKGDAEDDKVGRWRIEAIFRLKVLRRFYSTWHVHKYEEVNIDNSA